MKLTAERLAQIEEGTGEPPACNCCGYAADDLTEYRGPFTKDFPGGKGMSVFCNICASTFLSQCITYPSLYGDERSLWASIGWIANHLGDEIRAVAKSATVERVN